jgi:hypothetical protein
MMTSRSLICLLENQNGGKLQKNIAGTLSSLFQLFPTVGRRIWVQFRLIIKKKKLSHLHPAARQFCRSTYTITDITIK